MWPNGTLGTTVAGTCIKANGWTGVAQRACHVSGEWGPITTACQPYVPCPPMSNYQDRSSWPETDQGFVATGTCLDGFVPQNPAQPGPLRACMQGGVWASEVTNDCVHGRLFADSSRKAVASPLTPRHLQTAPPLPRSAPHRGSPHPERRRDVRHAGVDGRGGRNAVQADVHRQ